MMEPFIHRENCSSTNILWITPMIAQDTILQIWLVLQYTAHDIDHFYTERNEMEGKTIWNNIVLEFEQYSLSYAILHNLELNKIQLVQSIIEGTTTTTTVAWLYFRNVLPPLSPNNPSRLKAFQHPTLGWLQGKAMWLRLQQTHRRQHGEPS